MVPFVVVLIASWLASALWCAAELLPRRVRAWWLDGRRLPASAVLLCLVILVAAGLRWLFVPPHHAMYVDEPWYAEAACNLVRRGRLIVCEETWSGAACIPYGKALGWPILIAPWTLLAGCDTASGVHLNRLLGVATVLLAAIAARCAGATWWQGVIAAAILAVHPVHVAWSATGETNVSAAAALLSGLCGALIYARTGRWCGAALAGSGLGLSAAIRPESVVPALVAGGVLAAVAHTTLRRRLVVFGAIAAVCTVAALSGRQLWAMNESISGGAFLSLGNILRSARLIAGGESLVVHGAIMLLAVGALFAMRRCEARGAAGLLFCTAVAGAVAVLAYDRFHERMLLGATVAVVPLVGFLLARRAPVASAEQTPIGLRPLAGLALVVLVVVLWSGRLRSAAVPPETQLLETRIASRVARLSFAADSLFIAEQPTVLAASGMWPVMATARALESDEHLRRTLRGGRPTYFLADMYCEPGFQGMAAPSLCAQMVERFTLSPVAEERLHNRAYILYRVSVDD